MDYKDLLGLVLPTGILEYFEIITYNISCDRVDLYLEEKPYNPPGYELSEVTSHGFTREITLQDFPFRDKSMYLHIKRRRYLIKSTGTTYNRDLSVAFTGTKITAEFAAFLKDIYR